MEEQYVIDGDDPRLSADVESGIDYASVFEPSLFEGGLDEVWVLGDCTHCRLDVAGTGFALHRPGPVDFAASEQINVGEDVLNTLEFKFPVPLTSEAVDGGSCVQIVPPHRFGAGEMWVGEHSASGWSGKIRESFPKAIDSALALRT